MSGLSRWAAPFALAFAALLFAAITGHTWEDYLITFRSSANLAHGNGLVFQVGERVHTFTSPLGTLIPAGFAMLSGAGDAANQSLWGLRIVSALALGAALALACSGFRRDSLHRAAIGFAIALWIFDPKIIGFAINGMETGILVFFIVLVWRELNHGDGIARLAVGIAGLQWTRPDGAIFFIVLGLAWFALVGRDSSVASWRDSFGRLVRASAVAVLLYLPWFAWAWWYYGSPIPHTILAKIPHHASGELAGALLWYPIRVLSGQAALHDLFLPAYHFFGGWPTGLSWFSRVMAWGAAFAWIWPRVPKAGRVASLAFFLGGLYVEYIPRSPWYQPGWQVLALLAWASLAHALLVACTQPFRPALRIAGAVLLSLQIGLLISVCVQLRAQQTLIENGHRREIGLWLAEHADRNDRVFLECLGYIGYYSQLKMLDFPGLASPEVVAARRAIGDSWARLIDRLQPEWLVLRPWDAARVFNDHPTLSQVYALAREFNVQAQIDARPVVPGRGFLHFDAVFLVYRRQPN